MGWVGLERALLSLGTKRRGRRAGGVGRSVGAREGAGSEGRLRGTAREKIIGGL